MKGFLFAWNIALTIAVVFLMVSPPPVHIQAIEREMGYKYLTEQSDTNRMKLNEIIDFTNENRELIRQQAENTIEFAEAMQETFTALGEYLEAQDKQSGDVDIDSLLKLMQLLGYL